VHDAARELAWAICDSKGERVGRVDSSDPIALATTATSRADSLSRTSLRNAAGLPLASVRAYVVTRRPHPPFRGYSWHAVNRAAMKCNRYAAEPHV